MHNSTYLKRKKNFPTLFQTNIKNASYFIIAIFLFETAVQYYTRALSDARDLFSISRQQCCCRTFVLSPHQLFLIHYQRLHRVWLQLCTIICSGNFSRKTNLTKIFLKIFFNVMVGESRETTNERLKQNCAQIISLSVRSKII